MRTLLPAFLVVLGACVTPRPLGKVELGQPPEVVLGAMGQPDKKYSMVGEKGSLEIWAYSVYSRPFDVTSERAIGQTPKDVPGGGIRDDERARIVFRDGKVVLVESRDR